MDEKLSRYHRQVLLPGIGEPGQRALLESHALIVGCGALGTVVADGLARAGVGTITIVDRDTVEMTNLQRQVLFTERDAIGMVPKARAAHDRLKQVNSGVTVRAFVDDFGHRNAERYAEGADVLLDGLDNFETRYLLNDLAVKRGLPYVYAGVVATGGMSMPILPHPARAEGPGGRVRWTPRQSTPCLRCVFPQPPPPGSQATCDTAGVLGPAVMTVAALQVTQALKLLAGHVEAIDRSLLAVDVWENTTRRMDVGAARLDDCPCCGQGRFEFLRGESAAAATSLCGRNAVQIVPAEGAAADLDLAGLAERLAAHGRFRHTGHLVHGRIEAPAAGGGPYELTVFPDGRAIIKGTAEPETARSVYARYVGI